MLVASYVFHWQSRDVTNNQAQYYYAIGRGTSVDGSHLQFTQGTVGACNGIYYVADGPANQGGTTVGFEVDCASDTAIAVRILGFQNPQSVLVLAHCDLIVERGPGGFTLLCGPNQMDVNRCSSWIQQSAGPIGTREFIQNVGIYLI